MKKVWIVGLISTALVACGDTSTPTDPATPSGGDSAYTCGDVAPMAAADSTTLAAGTAGVRGRLLDQSCMPVSNVMVLACTDSACLNQKTDEAGIYNITGLEVLPQKMQANGSGQQVVTMIWWQGTEGGALTSSPRDVVLRALTTDMQTWADQGDGTSTVTVADGALAITAHGELHNEFDILWSPESGHFAATFYAAADLPPFDQAPWETTDGELVEGTLAYVFDPFGVKLEGGDHAEFSLTGTGAAAGTVYDLYEADKDTGTLHGVGTATADDGGTIHTDDGGTLHQLHTVVLVPRL